ncbi:MAG TPA: MFS transporter [Streptosporangiaceae bacterium]|nr:MFS transporter [Streptosporangiaceae bacterium]
MTSPNHQRTASAAPSVSPVPTTWTPQMWGIILVLGGALCLDALDVSMVGVALPSIRAALGLSTASLQWIISGYVLGYGGLLLLGGRAADLLGRRRVFIAALAVFAVVSLLGGLVSSPALLIGARFVKGVAAAFIAPASMSLVTTTFPEGPLRNRAFSIYTVFGASGFSLGLVLSGLLTSVSWRWTLLVPAPVTVLVLIGAVMLIPRSTVASRAGRKFDIPGALAVTAAMLLLVYTVVSAQQAGWASLRTIFSFVAVALLLVLFTLIERRSSDPLVPFSIFRSAALVRADIGAITLFGTYVSFQFLITQYLQSLSGWSAIGTALAFLPAGLVVVVLSLRMAGLLGRFGPGPLVAAAFVLLAIAYLVFLRVGVQPDYPAVMLPAVILIGLAFGLGFSSLSVAATAGVPAAEQGLAASLFQTSFQVGGAVVLAVVTAVVEAGGATKVVSPAATLNAYRPALVLITAIAAVGMLVALSGLRRRRALPAGGDAVPASAGTPERAGQDVAALSRLSYGASRPHPSHGCGNQPAITGWLPQPSRPVCRRDVKRGAPR